MAGWKGGHKQECERLREGAEAGGGTGGAATQEALRGALLGTSKRAPTDRQRRVLAHSFPPPTSLRRAAWLAAEWQLRGNS